MLLQPHPTTPAGTVETLWADAAWTTPGRLSLNFELAGDTDRLRLAPEGDHRRTDELWRTTCFEAFLRPAGGEAYVELNLAPSGAWAAYAFDQYRSGMRDELSIALASFERGQTDRVLSIAAEFDIALAGEADLGLSAVVEGADGAVAYWALAHAPGRPDFHHPDCFAQRLTPSHRP